MMPRLASRHKASLGEISVFRWENLVALSGHSLWREQGCPRSAQQSGLTGAREREPWIAEHSSRLRLELRFLLPSELAAPMHRLRVAILCSSPVHLPAAGFGRGLRTACAGSIIASLPRHSQA